MNSIIDFIYSCRSSSRKEAVLNTPKVDFRSGGIYFLIAGMNSGDADPISGKAGTYSRSAGINSGSTGINSGSTGINSGSTGTNSGSAESISGLEEAFSRYAGRDFLIGLKQHWNVSGTMYTS